MRWSISDDCTKLYFEYDDNKDGVKKYRVYEKDEMTQTTRFGQRYSEREVLIGILPICNYQSCFQKNRGEFALAIALFVQPFLSSCGAGSLPFGRPHIPCLISM